MSNFFYIVDNIFFIVFLIYVGYLFFFALLSLRRKKKNNRVISKKLHFLIIIPAYKEDDVIFHSVTSFLEQDYPFSLTNIVVVSDNMEETTNAKLVELPIQLLVIENEKSSKANALKFAINKNTVEETYDVVVIIDADNTVDPSFLSELNVAFNNDNMAVQAHRKAKNINTSMAVLDAISEEINNSIFRKGHVNVGLSCALIGSGMAFDYKWFVKNVYKLNTAGEDKELERLLLQDGIYIDYLDNVPVYDEKVQKVDVFYNQRRRWIASQVGSLAQGIKDLPTAIFQVNIDHINKIFQHTFLPRVVLLGLLGFLAFAVSLISWSYSLKWWILLLLLLLTFVMAIPDEYVNKKTLKSMKMLPLIFAMMVVNFFKIKGVNKNFIHTKKGGL